MNGLRIVLAAARSWADDLPAQEPTDADAKREKEIAAASIYAACDLLAKDSRAVARERGTTATVWDARTGTACEMVAHGVAQTAVELALSLDAAKLVVFMERNGDVLGGRSGLDDLIVRLASEIEALADWTQHDWYLTCDKVADVLLGDPYSDRWDPRDFHVTADHMVPQ